MMKILIILLLVASNVFGATYYVSPTGNNSNDGSLNSPWLTWQYAVDQLSPGDTLYIRGGVYNSASPVNITTTGTRNAKIFIFGYPQDIATGNWPILDCYQHCDNWTNPWNFYNAGIVLDQVAYYHLKNLEVRNVFQCDSVLNGAITANLTSNITYEQLRVHDVGERGFWHQTGAWNPKDSIYAVDSLGASPAEATAIFRQPDTTRWINCDVWNICDSLATDGDIGNGGDAWKVISSIGNYYYWYGCRAWNYSDDGFDPNKGERVFENCWAMSSGKYAHFGIEGNGFKTSNWRFFSDDYYHDLPDANSKRLVKTKGCLTLFCVGTGFYHGVESDSTDNAYWVNNTAYKCGYGFTSRHLELDSIGDVFRNNAVYGSTYITATEEPYDCNLRAKYARSNNTWVRTISYPYFDNTGLVSEADFAVTDSATLVSLFTASRQSNGELPTNKPLQLSPSSDLIDAGTQIPESDSVAFYPLTGYLGLAPDIGYAEYDTTIVVPSDSIKVTTLQQLSDSLAFGNRTAGDIVYLDAETFSGNMTWGAYGANNNLIYIKPATGRTPTITGNVTITGQYLRVDDVSFDGLINITGSHNQIKRSSLSNDGGKSLRVYNCADVIIDSCTFASTDTVCQALSVQQLQFTYNVVTSTGHILQFTYPTNDKNYLLWNINYNTYNTINGKWNGKSWYWYRSRYLNFDRNSIYNP